MKHQLVQAAIVASALIGWISWYGFFGFRLVPVEVFRWMLLLLAACIPAGPLVAVWLGRSSDPKMHGRKMFLQALVGLALNAGGAIVAFAIVVLGRGMTGAGT